MLSTKKNPTTTPISAVIFLSPSPNFNSDRRQDNAQHITTRTAPTMAVLGKRKASEQAISDEEAQEIFRRHFEAQFQPLPDVEPEAVPPSTAHADDTEDEEEESEWGGLSDDAEDDDAHAHDDNKSEYTACRS